MHIVFLIFDRITALDAVGPYEVLARLPGAKVTFAAPVRGPVRTDNGALGLVADAAIDEIDTCDPSAMPPARPRRSATRCSLGYAPATRPSTAKAGER
jgi:hypothetical protein